jgi:diadenosine tetraphosphate (Ap4A) HIT family hydrolase
MQTACPFCNIEPERIIWSSDLVYAIEDGYPVSPGHTLVIPKRHCPTYFDAIPEEQVAIWEAVHAMQARLQSQYAPDGFNVGMNCSEAAGQTVMHTHIHIIPRYKGDVDDPRGGVRWVISDKAKYW